MGLGGIGEAEPTKKKTFVYFMNSSHANMVQGIKNLVVLAYYQFVWMWNSKQTLEGVNTDVNQNQKKSLYNPMRTETNFFVLFLSESEMHQEIKPS